MFRSSIRLRIQQIKRLPKRGKNDRCDGVPSLIIIMRKTWVIHLISLSGLLRLLFLRTLAWEMGGISSLQVIPLFQVTCRLQLIKNGKYSTTYQLFKTLVINLHFILISHSFPIHLHSLFSCNFHLAADPKEISNLIVMLNWMKKMLIHSLLPAFDRRGRECSCRHFMNT